MNGPERSRAGGAAAPPEPPPTPSTPPTSSTLAALSTLASLRARLTGRLADRGYAAGWALVRQLPEGVVRRVFQAIADAAWWRRGRSVRRLEANLARVLGTTVQEPRLRELSRAAMRSYLRYWREAFRLPEWSAERIVSTLHTVDEHRLHEALARGRGAVVALPHMANWDHAGAWAVASGIPFTTVAERLKPESLFDRFVAYRVGLGMEVLPLTGGTADVFGTLSRRLRAGRMVCLLGDRDLTVTGVEVSFFGGRARMPAGPAALALHTGAALIPVTLWYDADGTHVWFHPEVRVPGTAAGRGGRDAQVAAMTQAAADVFARGIAEHPEDWHMLQRLWIDEGPGHRDRPGEPADRPVSTP
ncbi:MAG: phosphatidylinositol mannoside acyltransferase [Streptomycetales bacterium]